MIHFGEIYLKGQNRPFFIRRLSENLKKALASAGLKEFSLRQLGGRLVLQTQASNIDPALEVCRNVFGISWFTKGYKAKADLDDIKKTLLRSFPKSTAKTFRITSRRASTAFALSSQQINEALGEFVIKKWSRKVNLDRPGLTIWVDVVAGSAFIYFERRRGLGGLPAGVGGRAVCLLSGGIDSPVAAWRIMKRGATITPLHLHSYPYTSRESVLNVKKIIQKLHGYSPAPLRSYFISLAKIQRSIIAASPPRLRLVLYRRSMFKIARSVAEKEKALALVTGESLGQVASQTLENIRVIDEASSLPVLRPNIGDDKQEIIDLARRIGTFELSTLPFEDCCSFLIAKHPETKADLAEVKGIEGKIPLSELEELAVRQAEVLNE